MAEKYSRYHLNKLIDKLREFDYTVRYEKGNFQTGFCILETQKVIVVNKFHDLDARIESLRGILAHIRT